MHLEYDLEEKFFSHGKKNVILENLLYYIKLLIRLTELTTETTDQKAEIEKMKEQQVE